jgi:hypothetical protein
MLFATIFIKKLLTDLMSVERIIEGGAKLQAPQKEEPASN